MSTTFILRDNPKPDEVTVRIYQDADAIMGQVLCPGGVQGTHTAAGADRDGMIGVHQALASAIELCPDHGNIVGIIDDDGLWKEEWGDLLDESKG